jgi:putative hydroxymethylpyrimidine transporter CytX
MPSIKQDIEAAHWGIDPVPDEGRRLSGLDIAVLWGDLGIGLLVVITGALLVAPPEQFGFGLALAPAMVAIALGSILGCALLAFGGLAGTREGRPTMALLRPVLGNQGSWIPSVLNAGQLLGWTAVELWAMALVGEHLGSVLFGFSSFGLWLAVFTALVLALALWGPLGVVRAWMERFGIWVLLTIGAVVTGYVLLTLDLGALFSRPGAGGTALFGPPLDLVIVMPVSWLPLVADYNRFSRAGRGSFWGTFGGYLAANIWFYALGALLVTGVKDASPDPAGLAMALVSLGGAGLTGSLLLAGLLVGETDEAFADAYSAAVSLRNIAPGADGRALVIAVTLLGAALAGRFTMGTYELFLFLLGSVFLPLFGVWFADYFVLGNRVSAGGVRLRAVLGWLGGFLVYHWIAPTPLDWWTGITERLFGQPLSVRFPWLGASLPSFLVAFALHLLVGSRRREPAHGEPGTPRR